MEKDLFSTRTARKCAEISRILEKEESRSHARRVAHVLKKNETERSDEEKLLLLNSVDVVLNIQKRANSRMLTKQRLLEIEDSVDILREKCDRLAVAIRDARHLVIYTGAGISTAASIPDYRGPNGVWTLLQQGKEVIVPQLSDADPTYTHMCITSLYRQHLVKHVVSQNCDALHLRSGLPRHALSELHGNMHIEVCNSCDHPREYIRLFDLTERTGVRRHQTGRKCSQCGAPLQDTIVHFGEKGRLTSPYNWKEAARAADHADVILCLGTSLKVLKKYPCLWSMHKSPADRPKLYIVNLQWTPKDDVAVLKINGRSDEVMKYVMTYLDLPQPVESYVREEDPIFLMATPLVPNEVVTTSTKPLVTPPGYRREKVEAILLDDITALKKVNNGAKNRQRRKKQSDSCRIGSSKRTEQQNGSRRKREKYKDDIGTDDVNESEGNKRCRTDVGMINSVGPHLCDQHGVYVMTQGGVYPDDRAKHDVTVSKSDSAVEKSDSNNTHTTQGSTSSTAVVSHHCDSSNAICDISVTAGTDSGMARELSDSVSTGDSSGETFNESIGAISGKTSAHRGDCMLEHAYCRSCCPTGGSVARRPALEHQSTGTCQHGSMKVGLSHGSGILSDEKWSNVSEVNPPTTNSPTFTHLRTRTGHSPGCSSVRCNRTNDESPNSECLCGMDVSCSISPAQCISALHGDEDFTGTTSSGISDTSFEASVQLGRRQLVGNVCPAQNVTITTSSNSAESANSDVAKASVGGQFPTIVDALQLRTAPQQNPGSVLQQDTGGASAVTTSPEPHSELISCTATHNCREIKSEETSVDRSTVECDNSVAETSEFQVKTSAEFIGVNSYASSTELAKILPVDGTQESTQLRISGTGPNVGASFGEKEEKPGKAGNDDVKATHVPDTSRNTITATSPGWFGKGLSLRKARRKKSW